MSSQDKLVVTEDFNGMYFIAWLLDDDYGASIGELCSSSGILPAEPSIDHADEVSIADYENWFVTKIVAESKDVEFDRHERRFVWETKTAAFQVLRNVRARLRAWRQDIPLPDWAQQAIAHGWKMPKGWKP